MARDEIVGGKISREDAPRPQPRALILPLQRLEPQTVDDAFKPGQKFKNVKPPETNAKQSEVNDEVKSLNAKLLWSLSFNRYVLWEANRMVQ